MKKRAFTLTVALLLFLTACNSTPAPEKTPAPEENSATTTQPPASITESTPKDGVENLSTEDASSVKIILGETILLEGEELSKDSTQPVYLQTLMESHPDISPQWEGQEYQAVTIQESGIYEFSGELENSQIRIDAPGKEDITIVLGGVTITNHTAPGIYVVDALDKSNPEEGGVTLTLAPESINSIEASHIGKYFWDAEETQSIKNDGAISSNVSLLMDGSGYLKLTGDKEGIEVKNHLTINGGHWDIEAMDDSVNASEDGVSHITINDGTLYAKSIRGSEGDGIDSNGYITINGGNIIAVAHPTSMDSGLDSDLGITINGGTIAATGHMYDEILTTSSQQFINLSFGQTQPENTLIVLTKEDNTPLYAYTSLVSFSNITMSDADLEEGNYRVYLGGSIEGTLVDGLYTEITSYTPGTLQQHTGPGSGGRPRGPAGPSSPPPGGVPPEIPPEGSAPTGSAPTGDTPPSTVFVCNSEAHVYGGVTAALVS